MSRLDIVVFGATGFTGKHAVAELVPIAKQRGLTWGVAGRSLDKLTSLLKEVAAKTGEDLSAIKTIIADVQNEKSLKEMCEQAKVVISCCGPYTLYGEPVVQAAIAGGAHYVDCSGEPHFIEGMQLKYQQKAREAGVYVVSACGFESIPVDLGVLFLQDKFDGILNSVESYMSAMTEGPSINSGTWESLVLSVPHLLELRGLRKQIYPDPPTNLGLKPKLKYRLLHKRFNGWCLPFPANDSSAVYRTQRFLHETEHKRPAQIKTYVKFPSLLTALALAFASVFIVIMSYFKLTRSLLLKYPSVFTAGLITSNPSEEMVQKAEYEYLLYGAGWETSEEQHVQTLPPRKTMVARIYGKNPGYGMTVFGLIFSAVAILQEQSKMPAGGGVLSPGQAFSKTSLLKHLQENNVNFEIVSKDKTA